MISKFKYLHEDKNLPGLVAATDSHVTLLDISISFFIHILILGNIAHASTTPAYSHGKCTSNIHIKNIFSMWRVYVWTIKILVVVPPMTVTQDNPCYVSNKVPTKDPV